MERDDSKLKPPSEVLSAHLGDETVLLNLNSKRYYRLNETAAAIYRALEAGAGRDGAIKRVLELFEIDETTATAAVDEMLTSLATKKLLEMPDPDSPR